MPTKITKDMLPAIVDRLRNGSTALLAESKALGYTHNGALRSALRELLGREGYDDLMQGKRPAMRAGDTTRAPRAQFDETDVPRIDSMRIADGWTWRRVSEHEPIPRKIQIKDEGTMTVQDSGERFIVMRSPEGIEYVAARPSERAALLRHNPMNPSAPFRFVEWEKSETYRRVTKRLAQHDALIEQAEESKAHKKAATEPPREQVAPPPKPAATRKPIAKKAVAKKAVAKKASKKSA